MAGGIVPRMKLLIASHWAALSDAVKNDDPVRVMDEALSEIDQALNAVRRELGLAIADRHNAAKGLAELVAQLDALDGDISDHIAAGRDETASAQIARQIDLETDIKKLETTLSVAVEDQAALEVYVGRIADRRRQLAQMRQQYMSTSHLNGGVSHGANGPGRTAVERDPAARVESAENRFRRALQDVIAAPFADGDLNSEGLAQGGEDDDIITTLNRVSRDARVHERLAAIKAAAAVD